MRLCKAVASRRRCDRAQSFSRGRCQPHLSRPNTRFYVKPTRPPTQPCHSYPRCHLSTYNYAIQCISSRYPQKSTFSILSDSSSNRENAVDGGGSGGGGGKANFDGGRNNNEWRGAHKSDAEKAFAGARDGEQRRSPVSSAEETARAQVGC